MGPHPTKSDEDVDNGVGAAHRFRSQPEADEGGRAVGPVRPT
jgi:hypothetical protein